MEKPKVIVLCGSTKYVQIMSVIGWLLEKEEGAIVMGLHLLPWWYPNCPPDHLAEHENVKEQLDELHMRKIDLADEIFVVNQHGYIGNSTKREIEYAQSIDLDCRWYCDLMLGDQKICGRDPLGVTVDNMLQESLKQQYDEDNKLLEHNKTLGLIRAMGVPEIRSKGLSSAFTTLIDRMIKQIEFLKADNDRLKDDDKQTEYNKFIDSIVKDCSCCRECNQDIPCAGVMAGGPCDKMCDCDTIKSDN